MILVMGDFRDSLFNSRKIAKQSLFSKSIDQTRLNLGSFRFNSDIQIDLPLYQSALSVDWRKLNQSLISSFNDKTQLIFINLSLAKYLDAFFSYIENTFTGTFIIDSLDTSLETKPEWVGNLAKWAAPHILNPKTSSGFLIPLGVEERRRFEHNKPWLFAKPVSKPGYILVGPFAPTNLVRNSVNTLHPTPEIEIRTNRLGPLMYSRLAGHFRFVFCPPGNGIDTHRFWETLYRGSIPIVLRSEWSTYFLNLGIPMLELNDIGELIDFRRDFLSESYEELNSALSRNYEILTNFFWITKIRDL